MNMIIGLLIIAISIMLMYTIGRITIHVIEPSNKHPDLMMIMLGFCIFTVAIVVIVAIFKLAAEIGGWMMR